MIDEMARLWWMFSIRGLLSLAFAYICLLLSSSMQPLLLRPAGFLSMQILFSFYIVASGFVFLTGALFAFDVGLKHRFTLLINSFFNIGLGFFGTLALSMPLMRALFGVHALGAGLLYLANAARMRRERNSAVVLAAAGLCSAIAGTFFIFWHTASMVDVTRGIAIYSLVLGLLLLALSFSLRFLHRRSLIAAARP